MGNHKLYLYPVWLRLWHALNAFLCLALLITGGFMYFGSNALSFATSVKVHNTLGLILIANYTIFFFGNLFTKNGHHYVLVLKGLFKRLMAQFMYYSYGIFKGEEAPFPVTEDSKFNPLQQVAYYAIMYGMVPVLALTGIAMLFPDKILFELFHVKGIVILDLIHIIGGFSIILFLLIHLYFSTLGEKIYTHFKSIITGWH